MRKLWRAVRGRRRSLLSLAAAWFDSAGDYKDAETRAAAAYENRMGTPIVFSTSDSLGTWTDSSGWTYQFKSDGTITETAYSSSSYYNWRVKEDGFLYYGHEYNPDLNCWSITELTDTTMTVNDTNGSFVFVKTLTRAS